MTYYSLSPDIVLVANDESYLAYDVEENLLHEFNPVAALLLELCNGQRTLEEILDLASPYLDESDTEATSQWFDQAIAEGVLQTFEQQSDVEEHADRSAEQLVELASDLRCEGKIQAAYICQKQAVELEPNNVYYCRQFAELTHILGRTEETKQAYLSCLELEPDDAEVQHLLQSLEQIEIPDRVPNDCIEKLYERFSNFYEINMRDELGYVGPENMWEVLAPWVGHTNELNALDLGCGTGLSGEMIRPYAAQLTGIDLSPEMVDLASKRKIYDELQVAEIVEWLNDSEQKYDLILSCDAFIYFGDLTQIIRPALKLLNANGAIAFSVEKSEVEKVRLTGSGRFVHHQDHIREIGEHFGLSIKMKEAFLRREYGRDVTGLYVFLTRKEENAFSA